MRPGEPIGEQIAPSREPRPVELLQAVVFRIGPQRFALPLGAVSRVIRAVEVTAVPDAPPIVIGMIDVEGRILPVLDLRRRMRLPSRELDPGCQFVIATAARRLVVLVADEVEGVVECARAAVIETSAIAPGIERFDGVIQLGDGLALIHDLDELLSLEESRILDESMARHE